MFKFVKIIIICFFVLPTTCVFAANPSSPFLPSDNIQDPNCTPQDSNCYVLLTSFQNEEITGLDYATSTGVLSLSAGYVIPTIASTTAWNTAIGALGGNALIQGGNSFGNILTLGTNDNQSLSFETNGIERLTIDAGGDITATGSVSANFFYGDGSNLTNIFSTSTSRNILSSVATGLTYSTSTGVFSLTSGYVIPTQTQLDNKQNNIATGTISQYFRGDFSLATFPTVVSEFTNDANYISNLNLFTTDNLTQGSNNLYSQWDNATGGINYAGGNVGVGTNSPTEKLEVAGTILATGAHADGQLKIGSLNQGGRINFLRGSDGSSNATFGYSSASGNGPFSLNIGGGAASFGVTTNGVERFLISNVGAVTVNNGQVNAAHFRVGSSVDANSFYVNAGTGNVGIGTTTPTEKLSVIGNIIIPYGNSYKFISNSAQAISQYINTDGSDNLQIGSVTAGKYIQLGEYGNRFTNLGAYLKGNFITSTRTDIVPFSVTGAASQATDLAQIKNSSGTVLFNVTNGGNVGIGTTTPANLLTVAGATNVASLNGRVFVGGGTPIFGEEFNVRRDGTSYFGITSTQTGGGSFIGHGGAGNLYISSSGQTIFQSSGTERMRFDGSGNMGVGTITPGGKIQIDTGTATTKGLIVRAFASQTSNLQEWQDSAGVVLSSIGPAGTIGIGASPNTLFQLDVNNPTRSGFRFTSGTRSLSFINFAADVNYLQTAGAPLRIVTDVNSMEFWTSGIRRVGISSLGGINMGTANNLSTSYQLSVQPTVATNLGLVIRGFTSQTANLQEWQDSAGTVLGAVTAAGNMGVGVTVPLDKLQVFGDIRLGTTGSNGCIKDFAGTGIAGTCSSDERLKTNVVDFSDGYLDKMSGLRLITYNWNEEANSANKVDTTVTNYGLLAQNVESIFPDLVSMDSKGYKQVNYSRLPLYLLKALQELSKKVTEFTNLIKTNKVETKLLCVEDVCVTKDQFKTMLQNSNITPTFQAPEIIPIPIQTKEPEEVVTVSEATEPVIEIISVPEVVE